MGRRYEFHHHHRSKRLGFQASTRTFQSRVAQYKVKDVEKSSGKSQTATILFEVFVPGKENYECLARKAVPVDLRAGSYMTSFLEGLLGPNYFKTKSNQAIDLQKLLVGQLCGVELIHAKHDENMFDFPLVDVEALYPQTPDAPKEGDAKKARGSKYMIGK